MVNKHFGFLLVDNHSGQGGLEKVLIDITKGLKEKYNINHTIISLYMPSDKSFLQSFDSYNIVPFRPKELLYTPKFIKKIVVKKQFSKNAYEKLPNILKDLNLDALIILDISKNFLRILPALQEYKNRNPKVPLIAWPHISFKTMPKKFTSQAKKALTIFDSTLSISQGLSDELTNLLNIKNVCLIYNPIKTATFIPKRNHKKFIYLGRVNDSRKRVYELLNVFQKISGEWRLALIGGTGSKKGDILFKEHIASLGLADKVTLSGWTNTPWDLVSETGTLLLNSTYEGFGLVLAEAMMRGIPCLSSNCPVGPNEIIQEGINGWLYDVDDEQKLQLIIQEIINGERELPPQAQVIDSVQKFSEEAVIENFKDNILKTISNKYQHES